jgi:AcrR family transcriptional regulator
VRPSEDTPALRSRYRRGEGAHLRQDILEAASALFVELGDEEKVTIRAVANATGVSPPSVYLHFADKDELIVAVCEALFADLDATLEAAAAGLDDPAEALRARMLAYARFGVEHPEQYRVLFMRKPVGAPLKSTAEELKALAAFGHLSSNVEAILATRQPRDDRAGEPAGDAYLVALEIWAAVHGYTSLVVSHPAFGWPPLEQMIERIWSHLLHGLLP